MRHHHKRLPMFAIKSTKQIQNFLRGLAIKIACRLVSPNDSRIIRESTGNGNALALPT